MEVIRRRCADEIAEYMKLVPSAMPRFPCTASWSATPAALRSLVRHESVVSRA